MGGRVDEENLLGVGLPRDPSDFTRPLWDVGGVSTGERRVLLEQTIVGPPGPPTIHDLARPPVAAPMPCFDSRHAACRRPLAPCIRLRNER